MLLLVLTACGPVPKPFKASEGEKLANPLITIPDGAGVTVAPIKGAPIRLSGALGSAMIEEFSMLGIPASTGSALTNGLLMEGIALWGGGTAIVTWVLTDAEGRVVATVEADVTAPESDYFSGAPDLVTALSRRSAVLTAAALRPDTVLPPAFVGPRRVAVSGVEGAPGDGNDTLAEAMRVMLERAGVPLAEDEVSADLLLAGSVEVAPVGDDLEEVTIRWWLLDANGAVLGSLEQTNTVPLGSLNERWGGAAYDAALANVEAIQDVLSRIDEIREMQRQAGDRLNQ